MELALKLEPRDDILRLIYEGTATATDDEFFRALVRATASAMGVRWAFVSEFAGTRERVRTLAFWDGDDFAANFEYDLDGTVCERVLEGEVRYYPRNVAPQFPRELTLVQMGIESYLAVPMTTPENEVLGHLAVFDLSVVIIYPSNGATITSGGLTPLVAVMKSADAGQCDDLGRGRRSRRDRTPVRCVFR